jgi:hypothetical protein
MLRMTAIMRMAEWFDMVRTRNPSRLTRGERMVHRYHMHLVVVDTFREEVQQWIVT